MPESSGDLALLVIQLRDGNQEAGDQRVSLVYSELGRMACAYIHRELPGHTLQATPLVHEAYMRLGGGEPAQWQNRAHCFGIAAHTLRQFLLDYARSRVRSSFANSAGATQVWKDTGSPCWLPTGRARFLSTPSSEAPRGQRWRGYANAFCQPP